MDFTALQAIFAVSPFAGSLVLYFALSAKFQVINYRLTALENKIEDRKMSEFDEIVKDLSKENVIKEKHEKRIIIGLNILAALWRLITFWKEKHDDEKTKD